MCRAVLRPDARRMPVHVPRERLLAVVDDLDRPVRVQRQHRSVDLHREVFAAAEGAADTAEVDPDLVERQPEARRDLRAVHVQPLRGHVDVDAALAVGHGQSRLRAEERLVLDAELVVAAHRHVGLRVGIAVANHQVTDDVRPVVLAVAVAARRPLRMQVLLLERALHVGDRLQLVVRDANALGRAPSLLGMIGRNESDRLAVVEDSVGGEHRLVGELEPVRLLPGNVVVRQHGVHSRHRHGVGDVDRDDSRVRVRAPQRVPPQHARRRKIARVGELARHLGRRVDAQHELADLADLQLSRRGLGHARAAAARTASKIFAYPVHRQRLPDRASRISSSDGAAL